MNQKISVFALVNYNLNMSKFDKIYNNEGN